MNQTEQLSDRLIKPWTAKGVLILKRKVQYIEVEVPYLALDAQEVARNVASNFEAVYRQRWDQQALAPGITEEELYPLWQAHNHEVAFARNDLSLAAAILTHRGGVYPTTVSRDCLSQYLYRRFLRGGRGVVDAGPVEFLFMADEPTPVIYATDPLAEVTRYTGRECLSIRVGDAELSLRVNEALRSLDDGGPPAPRSLTNMEDWLTRDKPDGDDDKYDE